MPLTANLKEIYQTHRRKSNRRIIFVLVLELVLLAFGVPVLIDLNYSMGMIPKDIRTELSIAAGVGGFLAFIIGIPFLVSIIMQFTVWRPAFRAAIHCLEESPERVLWAYHLVAKYRDVLVVSTDSSLLRMPVHPNSIDGFLRLAKAELPDVLIGYSSANKKAYRERQQQFSA